MNKENKIFVFDFDGVICDSTNECLINSLNSYYLHSNNKKNNITDLNEIDEKLVNNFKIIRPYIKGAKEYLKFYDYYFNNQDINIDNFINYENLSLNYNRYSDIFYSERENLKKNNLRRWVKLNFVFNDLINFLNSLEFYFIATLKDKESVIDIMSYNRINIFEEKIYDFKKINSKLEALDIIKEKYKYNKKDLIFVDDNAYHLIDPKNNGYKVYLSNWANLNNDKHIEIAIENKIDILDDVNNLYEKNSRHTS